MGKRKPKKMGQKKSVQFDDPANMGI